MKIHLKAALAAALALGLGLAARLPASATTCNIPYVFTTNTTINAAPFNADFSALQTCGNNVDNSQIGAAGLYASNILPTNGAQATFGGSQAYSFPAGLFVPSYVVAGSATAPAAPTAGDLVASRSTTTGALELGGSSSVATLDFGFTTSGKITSSVPVVAPGLTSSAGVAVGGALSGGTTGGFSGAVSVGSLSSSGAVSGTTGTFSGALSAAGLTSSAGVAVGGALTGGTSGAFSGTVTANTFSGPTVQATTGLIPPSGATIHAIAWGSCLATTTPCTATFNAAMPNTGYSCATSVVGNTGTAVVGTSYSSPATGSVQVTASSAGGSYTVMAICIE